MEKDFIKELFAGIRKGSAEDNQAAWDRYDNIRWEMELRRNVMDTLEEKAFKLIEQAKMNKEDFIPINDLCEYFRIADGYDFADMEDHWCLAFSRKEKDIKYLLMTVAFVKNNNSDGIPVGMVSFLLKEENHKWQQYNFSADGWEDFNEFHFDLAMTAAFADV